MLSLPYPFAFRQPQRKHLHPFVNIVSTTLSTKPRLLPFTALARTFLEHCQFVIAKLDVAVEAEQAIDLQVHQRILSELRLHLG